MAAVLQTGVNLGTMLASLVLFLLAGFEHRTVFLAGILPALLVLWIRRNVPEPEEWHAANAAAEGRVPRIVDLFGPRVRWVTLPTIGVCALALAGHWAFLFWFVQHVRRLPEIADWAAQAKNDLASEAMTIVMFSSIVGNFVAAAVARYLGYRLSIILMCLGYFCSLLFTYSVEREYQSLLVCLGVIGVFQGVFALFTMYLPPLFPTLLRTTGAGFCYNIGRIAAAAGVVYFGLYARVDDYRLSLLYAGFLFVPAAAVALLLPTREWRAEPVPAAGPAD